MAEVLKRALSGVSVFALLMILFSSAAAQAQTGTASEPKWSLSFDVGGQKPVSGQVLGAGTGLVLGFTSKWTRRAMTTSTARASIWRQGRLSCAARGSGLGGFTLNAAERIQVGVPSLPLFAQFDDYKAFGLDIGYRQY
jgi:hypothetical protein